EQRDLADLLQVRANRVSGGGEFGVLAGLAQRLGFVLVPDEIAGGFVLFGGLGDFVVLVGGGGLGGGRGRCRVVAGVGVARRGLGDFALGRDVFLEVVEGEIAVDVEVFAGLSLEIGFVIEIFDGSVGIEGVGIRGPAFGRFGPAPRRRLGVGSLAGLLGGIVGRGGLGLGGPRRCLGGP